MRPLVEIYNTIDYPDLLVGLDQADDSAVWRLSDEQALVFTTDFFTPIVDNPYDYGAIAAANSLSDIYAMGGKPFLALNVAALPPDVPNEILREIVRGGAEKCREAKVIVGGGHTIKDKEPKFGFAVLGFVHPEHILRKGGAQIGDVLFLSKPLGIGTTMTALKEGKAIENEVAEGISWMKKLNNIASELALEHAAHAATDITGFSLIGHAWEMARASHVGFRFFFDQIPFLSGAQHYAEQFIFPGGAYDNRNIFSAHVHFSPMLNEASQMLLFDPQTSGGLLMAVSPLQAGLMFTHAEDLSLPLWRIGEVIQEQLIQVQ